MGENKRISATSGLRSKTLPRAFLLPRRVFFFFCLHPEIRIYSSPSLFRRHKLLSGWQLVNLHNFPLQSPHWKRSFRSVIIKLLFPSVFLHLLHRTVLWPKQFIPCISNDSRKPIWRIIGHTAEGKQNLKFNRSNTMCYYFCYLFPSHRWPLLLKNTILDLKSLLSPMEVHLRNQDKWILHIVVVVAVAGFE